MAFWLFGLFYNDAYMKDPSFLLELALKCMTPMNDFAFNVISS